MFKIHTYRLTMLGVFWREDIPFFFNVVKYT